MKVGGGDTSYTQGTNQRSDECPGGRVVTGLVSEPQIRSPVTWEKGSHLDSPQPSWFQGGDWAVREMPLSGVGVGELKALGEKGVLPWALPGVWMDSRIWVQGDHWPPTPFLLV